jgi:alcohol oxidase
VHFHPHQLQSDFCISTFPRCQKHLRGLTVNLGPNLTMGLYTELLDDIHDVDVIVAGGNSPLELLTIHLAFLLTNHHRRHSWLRGCLTIGRSRPQAVHPALFPRNLLPNSKTALFWKGNNASQLVDREPIVPSGGTLDGGSSINRMVYTRPQRSDFESWNTLGCSANELWPFLKKVRMKLLYLCSNSNTRLPDK